MSDMILERLLPEMSCATQAKANDRFIKQALSLYICLKPYLCPNYLSPTLHSKLFIPHFSSLTFIPLHPSSSLTRRPNSFNPICPSDRTEGEDRGKDHSFYWRREDLPAQVFGTSMTSKDCYVALSDRPRNIDGTGVGECS